MSIMCYPCESQVINILHVNTTCTCMYASHYIIWSNAISMNLEKKRNIIIIRKYHDILFRSEKGNVIFVKIPLSHVHILFEWKILEWDEKLQTPNNPLSVLTMVQEADFDSRLWPETEEKSKLPFLRMVAYLGFKIPINDLRF